VEEPQSRNFHWIYF